jgi:uncharacterized GH25 family protein
MKHLFLTLIAMACTGIAAAHSPYLLPNKFDLNKRDHVSVQASFTENYFIPDVVMKADDYHVISPDGTRSAVAPIYTKDLAVLDVATAQDGTYRISTGNRAGRTGKAALLADGKWQFFDEREGPPSGGKVHEVRSITRADVYVSRGTPNDNAVALTNKGLEFEFLTHPNRLMAGSPSKVRVVYDGKALGRQLITVQKAALEEGAAASPVEVRSSADGSVTLPFTAPGIYHVMARHRFALPASEGKAESHTYAVTLEVAE